MPVLKTQRSTRFGPTTTRQPGRCRPEVQSTDAHFSLVGESTSVLMTRISMQSTQPAAKRFGRSKLWEKLLAKADLRETISFSDPTTDTFIAFNLRPVRSNGDCGPERP